ncbi:MAG: DNA-directed RNA polymerase subunit A' [Nanoarchaeota archaeon]|nr:DNA-directed RNA polymerase subunit A' [Nanoarchaeota archaeon]MCG2717866.1 DNA-directed RNA polymerase subunit A' [Nanoarchaeota archaeon]
MHVSKKVAKITFGLLSPREIKKIAQAKIITPELYDKEGYPVDGGLMDVRLGVIDPGLRCKTCGEKLKDCMGHFGYIELARPIIHIKHAKTILDVLRSTCRECNRILMKEDDIEQKSNLLAKVRKRRGMEVYRRLSNVYIHDLKNLKKCPYCQAKQYNFKLEKPVNFYENEKRISPIEVRLRLEKIPDKDLEVLGIDPKVARPEWMVLTILQIPPVTMRPSITLESGERSEDDLTHKLGDIVRINQRLFENINAGAPEIIVEDLWDLLQYHIITYFDNTVSQVPPARHRSGQPLKTLVERIKSKEGRFRYNLLGKRVNYAARTVISPDAAIKLNEVGIPFYVAEELTVPERVTEWNLKYLRKFVERGPKVYPGSNYVITPEGKKKKITDDTQELLIKELAPGFIVERHILDGDVAVFNRQPSLHRMSIMCHKIRVLPGKSFRLNPTVCNPYNADFDGDEMNLHIPQTEEARAEAEILMQVQTQIITPKNGYNVIGCVEDAISGNYLLTKEMEMPKEEAIQTLFSIGFTESSQFKNFKANVTGKEIFSAIIPNDFDFLGNSKACKKCEKCKKTNCDVDAYICIKKGKLISGTIDKNTIGEDNGTLLRALHRKYDADKTLELMGLIFRLGVVSLLRRGFTTGISDSDLPEKAKKEIQDEKEKAYKKVQEYLQQYKDGKIEAYPSKTVEETLELIILQELNKLRNKLGNIVKQHVVENNSTLIMASSGARGNILNLSMMSACVGQQALRGKRIDKGYVNRTLSIFKEHDRSPAARGFIKDGYKSGLTPYEFFFAAMTGRDSLMDTALRTPKSGYLYRRLSNALQDLRVEYDNTVRNSNKEIIQFSYGEDGIDVSKSEGGSINIKKIVKDIKGE